MINTKRLQKRSRSYWAVAGFNGFCDTIRIWRYPVSHNLRTLKKILRRRIAKGEDMSWYWIQKFVLDNASGQFVPVDNCGCRI